MISFKFKIGVNFLFAISFKPYVCTESTTVPLGNIEKQPDNFLDPFSSCIIHIMNYQSTDLFWLTHPTILEKYHLAWTRNENVFGNGRHFYYKIVIHYNNTDKTKSFIPKQFPIVLRLRIGSAVSTLTSFLPRKAHTIFPMPQEKTWLFPRQTIFSSQTFWTLPQPADIHSCHSQSTLC